MRDNRCILALICLLLVSGAMGADQDEIRMILDRCVTTNTEPKLATAVSAYSIMDSFPVMGNGNLMVTLSGVPENLTFHLGKTDFWRDKCADKALGQSSNVLAGYLNLMMPEMAGATFRQSVDFHEAEVTTTLTKDQEVTLVRSVVPHESDNILVNIIEHRGTNP